MPPGPHQARFFATHRLTFRPADGAPEVYEVMLQDLGRAYTLAEWVWALVDRGGPPDWSHDEVHGWRHRGCSTPDGRPGRVDAETLVRCSGCEADLGEVEIGLAMMDAAGELTCDACRVRHASQRELVEVNVSGPPGWMADDELALAGMDPSDQRFLVVVSSGPIPAESAAAWGCRTTERMRISGAPWTVTTTRRIGSAK